MMVRTAASTSARAGRSPRRKACSGWLAGEGCNGCKF